MNFAVEVAKIVGISPASCRRIAQSAHRRYKIFYIPKKGNEQLRRVAQPAREVKAVQRALITLLTPHLRIHSSATAYKPNSSILENARRHSGARFLTKLDFTSFFPSIDADTVSSMLRASIEGIEDNDVDFILEACLWRGDGRHALCIGAPSSPLLSNAAMFNFDTEVSTFAADFDSIYTRYSDDISISTTLIGVLAQLERQIRELCSKTTNPRLAFNEEKRVAVGRSTSMRVTGLTLANNGIVTVGRVRKRGVRAGLQRFIRHGMTLEEAARLKGEIAFVLSVEPSFQYVLLATYGPAILEFLPQRAPD